MIKCDKIKLLMYLLTIGVQLQNKFRHRCLTPAIENLLKGSGWTAVLTEAGSAHLGTIRMSLYIALTKMRFGLP